MTLIVVCYKASIQDIATYIICTTGDYYIRFFVREYHDVYQERYNFRALHNVVFLGINYAQENFHATRFLFYIVDGLRDRAINVRTCTVYATILLFMIIYLCGHNEAPNSVIKRFEQFSGWMTNGDISTAEF